MRTSESINSVILGAAAFGQPYGIANPKEAATAANVNSLLDLAWRRGIRSIDTAPVYGQADNRISAWMSKTGQNFQVISKLPPLRSATESCVEEWVRDEIDAIRRALGVNYLSGLLLHDPEDIADRAIRTHLLAHKQEGTIASIGISAYTPDQVEAALDTGVVDAVQLPINLFDRRMLESGILDRCRSEKVIVHIRSVFLQGLFFLDPAILPAHFAPLEDSLRRLHELANLQSISIARLTLQHVLEQYSDCKFVLGCYQVSEIDEICDIVTAEPLETHIAETLSDIGRSAPQESIDPRYWPTVD